MNTQYIDGLVEACDTVHQAWELQRVLEPRLSEELREYISHAINWKFRTDINRLKNQQQAD